MIATLLACLALATQPVSRATEGAANARLRPIRVVGFGALTGPARSFGTNSRAALEAVAKRINRRGGIPLVDGTTGVFDISYEDDHCSAADGIAIVRRAAASNALVAVGPSCSAVAEALYEQLQHTLDADSHQGIEMPVFTDSAMKAHLTNISPWAFRNTPDETEMYTALWAWVRQHRPELHTVYGGEEADFAHSHSTWSNIIEPTAVKAGMTVSGAARWSITDSVFTAQVEQLKAADADVVVISGHAGTTCGVLSEMARQHVRPRLVVGLTSAATAETLVKCAAEAEGMLIPTSFVPQNSASRLAAREVERAGGVADLHSMAAWEILETLAKVIEREGILGTPASVATDRRKLREGLAGMPTMEGFLGCIRRLPDRESRKPFVLVKATHGVWQVAYSPPEAPQISCPAVGRPEIDELAATYDFLVSYRSTHGGALYKQTSGPLKSLILPFSFYDSAQYWGEYVCALPDVTCAVTDYYDASDYAVKPQKGKGAPLQTERVNVHNGTNIYDAATWQIGVMLGATVNKFGNSLDVDPYELAANQNRVLSEIRSTPNLPLGRRAVTVGNLYGYNGHSIADPRAAYAFRMTAATWLADDPLKDTRYASLVTVTALPVNNPAYEAGRVAWSDWKPVTGDNAWAFLVGPLQAAYIHYIVGQGGKYVPFEEQSVQNALAVLPTFAAMQSASGAVYYAPSGTEQNDADRSLNPHYVSVENNLSLYAGLRVLQYTLRAELAEQRTLKPVDRERIGSSLTLINTMIAGSASRDGRGTRGLLAFFREAAWRDGEFLQGGLANDPSSKDPWVPLLEPQAVDVNTWGIAALGSNQIDRWFGFGAAYGVWKRVKAWGAYGAGHTILGVGYSDQDGNGQTADGTFRSGVMSAEWTAGAIVMVRNMIQRYRSVPKSSPDHADALLYEAELREDERQMLKGLQELRLGRYARADFPGKPDNYTRLIVEPANPLRSEPYVYSSKRYLIPFGWYGNPIPSTSSTAWIILIADEYDPFGYGGQPN